MCSEREGGNALRLLEADVDVRELSPVSLAFLGDGVLELLVRERLVRRTHLPPAQLHRTAVRLVSAKGQSAALAEIEPMLTERELDVVRRGRNASKAAVAKHATVAEYRASTGFEALIGWLRLNGEDARIREIFDAAWNTAYSAGAEKKK